MKENEIISHLSPLDFWDHMENGRVNSWFLKGISEELVDESENIKNQIEKAYSDIEIEIEQDLDIINNHIKSHFFTSRKKRKLSNKELLKFSKQIGLFLQEEYNKTVIKHSGIVFSVLKHKVKDIEHYIMSKIRPIGNIESDKEE